VAKTGVFLATVALVSGIVGCGAGGGVQYDLTIASSAGGSVTTPSEGISTYNVGTPVNLVGEAEEGYDFVEWTGEVGTIANVNDATTTVTMHGHYYITANFVVSQHDLTISSSEGGSVTTPGEGTLTYDTGTMVDLNATANAGYEFANWTGDVDTVADADDPVTTITINGDYSITANFARYMVAAGWHHTVGLKSDGTAVAVGDNYWGECYVGSWRDITQVAAGNSYTLGLKSDGTVVAMGDNDEGQCNVSSWRDIVQVAAGAQHTVGLKSDGTVIAAGWNYHGQCEVGGWANIVQVTAGWGHTVGLKSDGTVTAVGNNKWGQYDGVDGWTDIVQIAAGSFSTVGLKSDGTVVVTENGVGGWTDIIAVSAGAGHTVGLKSDGTVVAAGENDWGQCDVGDWTDIIQVTAGSFHTVGLRSDGTVVAAGGDGFGQSEVGDWILR